MRKSSYLLFPFLILLLSGCGISQGYGSTFVRAFSPRTPKTSVAHEQFNFHRISPTLWRSSQLSRSSIDRILQYRLKSIINLRQEGEAESWEASYAKDKGIHYFHFPLNPEAAQDKEQLKKILKVIQEPSNQPVLIHCAAGKDRTGMITAIYRMESEGKSLEEVYEEMLMYGYDEKRYPELYKILRNWNQ